MINSKSNIYGLVIIILVFVNLKALPQELISGLKENPEIIKFYKQNRNISFKSLTSGYIQLPFFDDFSGNSIFPNQNLWTDHAAYINHTQAASPLNIGVATLDAIDSTGNIYMHANNKNFDADILTSQGIDLEYSISDNVYLSFFYQPQGLMDPPEQGDSLILEFFDIANDKWFTQWSVEGDTIHDFKPVIIYIDEAKFLTRGFRFRFRNYASLADNKYPSLISNVDHWHIDQVYINKNRWETDTIPVDAGFTKDIDLPLKNYSSVPWQHFIENSDSEMNNILELEYRNNSVNPVNLNLKMEIQDLRIGTMVYSRDLGSDNIDALTTKSLLKSFNYSYNSVDPDSARFEIKTYFTNNPDNFASNDTCKAYQNFYNYYSYDDGNPENGYGLAGEGTNNALLAYKFHNYKQGDSLRAVQMYFNQSFENTNQKYLTLMVWNDFEGAPGDVLYQQLGVMPLNLGINEFHNYVLDTAIVVPETFYIGWKQTTTDYLNIGFDRNRDMGKNIFYNIYGYWTNSSFKGALMMRAVFSKYALKKGINEIIKEKDAELFNLYPNPTSDKIYINLPVSISESDIKIDILDNSGRIVFQSDKFINSINLNKFNAGFYYLRLSNKSGIWGINKFLIHH